LSVLQSDDRDLIKLRVSEYDAAVVEWNEKFGVFLVKLRFYTHYKMAVRLDRELQPTFVGLGISLERLTHRRLADETVSSREIGQLQARTNHLYGQIVAYNRDLMNALAVQQTRTYYGKLIELKPKTLEHFPTWELVKALFKPRIERPRIVRSPSELSPPFGSRE
jgi:hypothetical protein